MSGSYSSPSITWVGFPIPGSSAVNTYYNEVRGRPVIPNGMALSASPLGDSFSNRAVFGYGFFVVGTPELLVFGHFSPYLLR